MTNQQELISLFESLIQRNESETIDFKVEAYNLSIKEKQVDLVKDIICMYNTPRKEDAHIILGVKEYTDRPKDIRGIDLSTTNRKDLDQSSMQSAFQREDLEIEPFLRFRVSTLQYKSKTFAIITIPVNRKVGPCKVLKSNYPKLKTYRDKLYFRRVTDNDLTRSVEEVCDIMYWFQDGSTQPPVSLQEESQWDSFLEASFISDVSGFELSRKYILVTSPLRNDNIKNLSVLGEIPAILVLDFDPESDVSGLLYEVKGRLKRSLHIVAKKDRPTINPENATYWFFVRGLEGRKGTVEIGNYKKWKKSYGGEISEQLRNFAEAISPTPITCIVLWYHDDSQLNFHLKQVLNSIEQAFEDAVNFVIATKYPGEIQEIKNEVDVEIINIAIHQLCSGLDVISSSKRIVESNEYFLPSSSHAPIRITSEDRKWLEEELEIVHLNVGTTAPDLNEDPDLNERIGRRFLRGAEITWHELSLHVDVNREKTDKIKRQVETELTRRRA